MPIVLTKTVGDDGWHHVCGADLNCSISHKAWEENGFASMSDERLVATVRALNEQRDLI